MAGVPVRMADVSATATATDTDVGRSQRVVIIIDGSNEVFFSFDGTATTSSARLEPNEKWVEEGGIMTTVSIVCSAAETSSGKAKPNAQG